MSASVVALYRYPVKSFTPEAREWLRIVAGRVEGDRVLAFLRGGARTPRTQVAGGDWWPKQQMLTLMSTPGIARLALAFDEGAGRLRITLDGALLVEAGLDEDGRGHIAAVVAEFAGSLDERPGRKRALPPLRLVGDGVTSRFQDRTAGYVSLHGRASLLQLAEALHDPDLDERRFRSNIAVDGLPAWEEFAWSGRRVRVGEVVFHVTKPAVRCLATHANPEAGIRDRAVMTTLTRVFGHDEPSFAVMLEPRTDGEIRLGDRVEMLD